MKAASRFAKGSGVYECGCCGRATRATGRGDNEHAGLCAECFDLAGEENSLSDTDEFYSGAANVLAMIKAVEEKGGNASEWANLKAKAIAAL